MHDRMTIVTYNMKKEGSFGVSFLFLHFLFVYDFDM